MFKIHALFYILTKEFQSIIWKDYTYSENKIFFYRIQWIEGN